MNLYHIQTVPKDKIGALIATLSVDLMREVEAAIRFALGFEDLRDD